MRQANLRILYTRKVMTLRRSRYDKLPSLLYRRTDRLCGISDTALTQTQELCKQQPVNERLTSVDVDRRTLTYLYESHYLLKR